MGAKQCFPNIQRPTGKPVSTTGLAEGVNVMSKAESAGLMEGVDLSKTIKIASLKAADFLMSEVTGVLVQVVALAVFSLLFFGSGSMTKDVTEVILEA